MPLPADLITPETLARAAEDYRALHARPELSGQEHGTAAFVERRLAELGIPSFRCGGTGVVGVLGEGEPVVAFRADMDGLPVPERTGAPYASTATGVLPDGSETPVMHACGHDAHMAAALAVAGALAARPEAWRGTVVFVFQPAEETARGAAGMVADGLWDRAPRPEVVLGQHVTAEAAGALLCGTGHLMNLGDSWEVTIRGRGGHGAKPHETIDPVVLAAHIIVRLQTVVSRETRPGTPVVITVGRFRAGLKENVIPDEAVFTLNIRTPDEEVRERVLAAVRRIIAGETAASGAPDAEYAEISRFPRCYGDPAATAPVIAALQAEFGAEHVATGLHATGSEDVGALADAIGAPLVFWMFGGYPPDASEMPANHTAGFRPDPEAATETAVRAALAALGTRIAPPGGAGEEARA